MDRSDRFSRSRSATRDTEQIQSQVGTNSRSTASALGNHHVHHLSDIREVSYSSKGATTHRERSASVDGMRELPSTPVQRREDSSSVENPPSNGKPVSQKRSMMGLGARATSAMSLPLRDVPERRSSISMFSQKIGPSRKPSLREVPSWRVPLSTSQSKTVPNRGRSKSPVRLAMDRSGQNSEANREPPLHTIIRSKPRLDLLDKANIKNDRVDIGMHLPSPLFVGGGTVEGHVTLTVDGAALMARKKLKPVSISRLSIDVIGVEEVSDGRRWVFLSLGTDLFDEKNPPPNSLIDGRSPRYHSEMGWILKPASATIPFCINLPLNLGPPPYTSKQACIRYILCPTAYIATGEKRAMVRQSLNIQMLTIHDPEKALASLPSPLLATDALVLSHSLDSQTVRVTAGLHRQTWVNGSVIFVDIHIINGSAKNIKKIEVQLEKTTLWYTHAAAGTAEKSASHLRLPKRSDSEIVCTTAVKKNKDWPGIQPHASEVRTCPLEVPRGHVTISTGRYFEVRYFVNVVVSVSLFKSCAVQLPVTLIHINSLDVLPNSLAQVAASIEAKRSRTVPMREDQHSQYQQGQAFAAPRRQSLEQNRPESILASNDVSLLTQELDASPRRYGSRGRSSRPRGENASFDKPSGVASSHNHPKRHPSCYHCHLLYNSSEDRPDTSASRVGPSLPRLQVSTSGLGFSESEFELPPESPRKVMLSEQERKMINQQKELQLQRQFSLKQRKASVASETRQMHDHTATFQSWRNVAANAESFPARVTGPLQDLGPNGHNVPRKPVAIDKGKGKEPVREPIRSRSRSIPQGDGSMMRASSHTNQHRPGALSMDAVPGRRDKGQLDGLGPRRGASIRQV